MSGLMQKYKESLDNTPEPVRLQDLPPMVIDYRGLLAYAREKGVQPGYLSEEEKLSFVLKEDNQQVYFSCHTSESGDR